MKKILYIQNNMGLGGISTVTYTKQNYLVQKGYDVVNVFTHFRSNPIIAKRYDPKISNYAISYETRQKVMSIPLIGRIVWFIYFRCAYLFILLRIHPDIIISTFDHLEPTSVIILTFWKKRILEFHGMPTSEKTGISEWLKYNIKYKFYQAVTLTEGDKREKDTMTGCNALVIPNPITVNTPELSTCENKRIIIPARFSTEKGIVPFLPYWKSVELLHPDWELHLYGAGPEKDNIINAIRNNLLQNVLIHDYASNIYCEIEKSSILLLPSLLEGFGMTLLEAMTCGVPCVAFDCKYGPSYIIKDGEDGFVVEFKNYEQFVERINTLIEDEGLRKSMGEKARINIQRYNLPDIMSKWEKLFDRL